MKYSWLAIFVILGLAGCVSVKTTKQTPQAKTRQMRVLETCQEALPAGLRAVTIKNAAGRVLVLGVNDDFSWQQKIRGNGEDEAAMRALAAKCKLETNCVEGEFRLVFTLPPGKRPFSLESDFLLQVPRNVSVEIASANGSVEVADVTGSVRVKNQYGRVGLKSLPGEVQASTSYGSLSAQQIGPASLRNQSGEIKAVEVSGPLHAETSYGNLTALQIGGPAELNNQSGSIHAEDISGPIHARTTFGRIQVRHAGPANLANQSGAIEASDIGGDLTAATSFGKITVHSVKGQAQLANQSGAIEGDGIDGNISARTSYGSLKLVGRGTKIDVRNQSGAVDLTAISGQTAQISAVTSYNSLRLRLPADCQPRITAHTSFGKIISDFPLMESESGEGAQNPAAPVITLSNQGGDIQVQKAGGKL